MILETTGLTKSFKKKLALSNINFTIKRGEIVGLIGPNGSGKTTLLNILIGLLKPTEGSYRTSPKAQIGMSISRMGFFDDMTVKNNIQLYFELLNVNKTIALQVLNRFSIDYGSIKFGKLSAGMKQKISLALSFIHEYELILLDEPSNHLDIDALLTLRAIILERKEAGASFLITSHIFSDLEKICDRILFLKRGNLVSDSTTSNLIQSYGNLEAAYLNILK